METIYRAIDSDKIDHKLDNRIVGITPCFYCGAKSTYRADSKNVYCCKAHEEAKEN
jgi:hypothetical protein